MHLVTLSNAFLHVSDKLCTSCITSFVCAPRNEGLCIVVISAYGAKVAAGGQQWVQLQL